MSGKGSNRRPGANDALYLKNNPFPSLLERRKAREREEQQSSGLAYNCAFGRFPIPKAILDETAVSKGRRVMGLDMPDEIDVARADNQTFRKWLIDTVRRDGWAAGDDYDCCGFITPADRE